MDYSRQAVWWSYWPAYNANCVANVVDSQDSGRRRLMIGGRDGFVRRTDIPDRAIDSATAISSKATTPFTNYGAGSLMKTIAHASMGIAPKGNFNATLAWTRDTQTEQTSSVLQGGGDVLAPASANQFTLDTSALAGAAYRDLFMEFEEGGEFRSISYSVRNAGLYEDLEVHSISAAVELGAESTENT